MIDVKCPTCKKTISWSEEYPFRPFCSERCRLIDLGAWADESYKLPTREPVEFDDFEGSEENEQNTED